jgi:anaerobic nitric oxide reductase flavorubredoxin
MKLENHFVNIREWLRAFSSMFISNMKSEVEKFEIDFIAANYAEHDHRGALPELIGCVPATPVYCTPNGIKSLKK